ncbi:FabD/lysophospholipase-like protein [Cenococcum geophilum 1.58]|uniref:FabD/lysophospholipase-like protein n=1 Tax=Cenococcum geophilum 1.58 TaxID=794803 RepID=UPI0035901954|nr:FabD/lysophospholipase-like protein [Cenococcum geophilum 1.58]
MQRATLTTHGGEPDPLDRKGLCLLSLDGGGVRGLSSLYVLKGIMDRLNGQRKAKHLDSMKPCDLFDLIGGTSTGGLIAVMLGRLEMDVDECIRAYCDLAETVFNKKLHRIPMDFKGRTQARFDSTKLENAIKKVITERGASETELLNDGTERGCRVFVCAVDRYTKKIVRLRSYDVPSQPNVPATICKAALATSAATTFFDPVSIDDRSFADGGFGANNPVNEVEGEASNIWCAETGDLKPLVKCFISIGTGNPGIKAFKDNALGFLSQTMVEIATETENTEAEFIARWRAHYDEKRYFRFNVEQGLQDIGIEEYKEKGAIKSATDGYLSHQAQMFRARDCVKNLELKENMAATDLKYIITEYNERLIVERRTMSRTVCWTVPFEQNPRFVGRVLELARIEAIQSVENRCERVAIVGLGGAGKTQIALEFTYRLRQKCPDCSVFWVPVTNLESMQEAYMDISRQLKIPDVKERQADIQKHVQQFLSKESSGKWLLIFDNADDIDLWTGNAGNPTGSRLIDHLPKSKHGAIVFTTRSRKAAVKLAGPNVVLVDEMDDANARQLLGKFLIDPGLMSDDQATIELLQNLVNLPLAIVQAAAYINENQIPLSDYLLLLQDTEQNVIDLLSEEFEDDGRYHDTKNPIASTWLVSFKQIRLRDPLAADYLSFMSCIDAKDIPQSLLPPAQSMKQAVDAIGTLSAFSFITKRQKDQLLDLHRLVHLATRNWLRTEGSLEQWTVKALDRLNEVFPDDDHRNRSIWRAYLTHARYVLKCESDKDQKTALVWKFGSCVYEDGRYVEAESSFSQVMETRKRVLGEEHPSTLTSMANLASTFWNQGRWKEAEELQAKGLKICSRVLGEEHPSTLTSMANLASTFWNQGRWKEAEELEVQVMETKKRVLGEEHPSTLTTAEKGP